MLRLVAFVCSASYFVGVGGSNEFGIKFLEENKEKEGVITLPSGLQYRILHAGDGHDHPTADSKCMCQYAGRTAQEFPGGKKFDFSYGAEPREFAPNQVIGGWAEAMQLMVEGDKWELYIPSELGYGESGSPPDIGAGDVLVFTMEILQINGGRKPADKCNVATLDRCTDRQVEFLKTWRAQANFEHFEELTRLQGVTQHAGEGNLAATHKNEEQNAWLNSRIKMLEKMKDEL
jgi:FKBP-type peptidyl-prolyl cis-trans isomerase FklB